LRRFVSLLTTDLTDELVSATLENGSAVSYTNDTKGNRTSRTVGGVTRATWAWDDLSSLPVRTGEYDQTGLISIWLTRDLSRSTFGLRAVESVKKCSWECFREGTKSRPLTVRLLVDEFVSHHGSGWGGAPDAGRVRP